MTAAKLKVTQTGSPIGRPGNQRKTLIALGLNKLHRSRVIDDTPANRGRVWAVRHLLTVESVSGASQVSEAGGQSAGGTGQE